MTRAVPQPVLAPPGVALGRRCNVRDSTRLVPLPGSARERIGTAIGIALAIGSNVLCVAGAGSLVGPAFVGAAIVIAYWLSRTRPLAAIEFALWIWLLGPQVRRAVDYAANSYHDPSLVMVAAPLASLVLLPRVRELRWNGLLRPVRPLLVAATVVMIGYGVGAVRGGVSQATAALLVWLVPLLLGLQTIVVGRDIDELRTTLERVFVWGALIVGVYGIVQFYVVPGWDAFWMDNVSMASIGAPEPFEVRVFSTLNSPGPMAAFLTAAVLFLTDARHPLRLAAQIAGYVCLALSVVRSAWLACLLGLLIVLGVGRPRAKTTALLAIGVVTIGLLQMSGPMQTVIAERIEESREGRKDDSFVARTALHREMVPALVDNTVGHGLGATGVASRVGEDGAGVAHLDSGLIDFTYTLGLPAGLLVLGALTSGSLALARAAKRRDVLPAGLIAACVSLFAQLAAGNTLTGVGGVTFFVLWALGLRHVLAASHEARDTRVTGDQTQAIEWV
jgi:hypothetical protein